jgi:hypothetical protein
MADQEEPARQLRPIERHREVEASANTEQLIVGGCTPLSAR